MLSDVNLGVIRECSVYNIYDKLMDHSQLLSHRPFGVHITTNYTVNTVFNNYCIYSFTNAKG